MNRDPIINSKASHPNIIHILVDDLGYGDFSLFNHGLSETPFLDQFIQESTCLSQHYTSSPVCNPSRASLLTGRYPHRTGSIDTLEWRGLERLDLNEVTIADLLGNAGYRTGLIGKWHLGAFDPRYKPEKRGFDQAICFRGGMHDYYDWRLESGDRVVRADGRYLTDYWTDQAVDFITTGGPQPFYLHLTYNAPHTPLQAPEEDLAVFRDRSDLNDAVKTLYAMIRRLDRNIGRLLEQVDRLGLRDNTLIIFSSDNGPEFGGKGDQSQARFNCHLHGAKGSTYEGGIRVPAIMRWPDGLQASAQAEDGFFHMCDWLPTILSLAGIEVPASIKLDGVDQSSVLRGEVAPFDPKRCWQWNRYQPLIEHNAAIRDGDWKLIHPLVPEAFHVPDIHWLDVSMYQPEHFLTNGIITDPAPEVDLPPAPASELYNIKDDPLEQNNLAAQQPQRVQQMERDLQAWFEDVCNDLAKTRRD